MTGKNGGKVSSKAAQRGEPSYVWRAGQQRRLDMVREWGGRCMRGYVLENGCGVGEYLSRISREAAFAVGLDVEFERLLDARSENKNLVCAVGENLPFQSDVFDLVLSNEVIEHVGDDRRVVEETLRVSKQGGRMVFFCPNRGYPFETHGVYWRGKYHFGNIPLVNYLPAFWRNRLAPHVRIYTRRRLEKLFHGLPTVFVHRTIVFGAYDNIIANRPIFGKMIRTITRFLEKTPLRGLGLSHFWVVEKGKD